MFELRVGKGRERERERERERGRERQRPETGNRFVSVNRPKRPMSPKRPRPFVVPGWRPIPLVSCKKKKRRRVLEDEEAAL